MFFSGLASISGAFLRKLGGLPSVSSLRNEKALAVIFLVVAGLAGGGVPKAVQARPQVESGHAQTVVSLASLPRQAQETQQSILAGGPFAYSKDGSVFGNRERVLPTRPRGHYREYTVATPGARNRGAQRIVCGGGQMKAPEVCFYTADHYRTFRRIER